MNFRYPIYLTRLLSSLIVGILIISLIKGEFSLYHTLSVEFDFQRNSVAEHICKILGKIELKSNTLFYLLPICFFIGELFAGLSEFFIFDPMYSNIRISKSEGYNILEYSDFVFKNKLMLILALLLVLLFLPITRCILRKIITLKDPIFISKFNEFIDKKEKNFSLSEMYFNMHRILGGCAILFWILFIFWLLAIFKSKCGRLYDWGFVCANLLLTIFCIIQATNQRKFANKLIYFS